MNTYMKNRWKRRRERLIKQLGGKCVKCGSSEKLEFDHTNSIRKYNTIGNMSSASEKKIQEELKGCQLLCEKCHDEKSAKQQPLGGERYNSKFEDWEVPLLRQGYSLGHFSIREIQQTHNVSKSTIWLMLKGFTYRHIR